MMNRNFSEVDNMMDLMESIFMPIMERPPFKNEVLDKPFTFGMIKTDIKKEGEEVVFEMELPGFKKEEISISLDNGKVLKISAEKEVSNEEENSKTYIHKERSVTKVSRTFPLKEAISQESIKAKFENGILEIRIPNPSKKEDTSSRIEIL